MTVVLGGTTTLTSLGWDAPPPLLELHALKTSTQRLRKTEIFFFGVIGRPLFYIEI